MSDLVLKTAIANYGHTAPLKDGSVTSEMFQMEHFEISPVPMIFRRMVRSLEFDVAEMALATYLCSRAHGKRFTGLPIFLTHDFYHGGILVRERSGIDSPKDLEGGRVGVRSYTLTPGVWTRALLQTEYDVDLDAVTWVLSGDEHVAEFVEPDNVVSSPNNDLADMLLSGEIDATIGAGPIDSPDVRPLFPNAHDADKAWHEKTDLYPISHMLVVKDDLLESQPGIAEELWDVFSRARAPYVERLRSGKATDAGDEAFLKRAAIVGDDPIPFGFESARATLEAFIGFNVEQGVIPESVDPATLFPSGTLALA